MNRTRIMIGIALSLLVAQLAAAQMMGGGGSHHGSSPSNGNGSGGMTDGNMGSGAGMMGGGMGHSLIVGADGVAYALRTAATTNSTSAVEVVAIRPSGTIAWTASLDGRMTRLEASGNLLLVSSGDGDLGMDGSGEAGDEKSRLVALSSASGSVQWQVELDGLAASIEPFSGGVYVQVVRHDGASPGNGMHNGSNGTIVMKRAVMAIDNAGKVLWTLDLN
ncbi:MAG: hypothetical protein ABI837_10830 [Acidobacteriota bacterium]